MLVDRRQAAQEYNKGAITRCYSFMNIGFSSTYEANLLPAYWHTQNNRVEEPSNGAPWYSKL